MNRNNLINIPGMKGFIRKVAAFISEKQGYETIGNGSTGHKAYCNAESLKLSTLRSAYKLLIHNKSPNLLSALEDTFNKCNTYISCEY